MTTTQVLDKGFVRLVDTMGNDSSIVQAARVSYGVGTKSTREDASLINYLMEKDHTTPFEMCEIKLHLKMPIFIARQWMRHRTASINEISGRYSQIKDEYYVPIKEDIKSQSTYNKQGSQGDLFDIYRQEFLDNLGNNCRNIFNDYQEDLGHGVSREMARIGLPINTYTEFYWKIDLHNLLHFLRLRLDSHAQWEIRQYAIAIKDIVKQWVPVTWEAFKEHKYYAVKFSRSEHKALQELLTELSIDSQLLLVANKLGYSESQTMRFLTKLGR